MFQAQKYLQRRSIERAETTKESVVLQKRRHEMPLLASGWTAETADGKEGGKLRPISMEFTYKIGVCMNGVSLKGC